MAVALGSRLGPYEIVASLGAGGMGEVYRARDTRLDRTVAIKVLAAHRIDDPQMRQRFEREARAVAALSHPHICHLNDVGYHDGVDFLVMEYLEGETLAARLARAGRSPLSIDEALRHAIEMAEALSEAHRRGVVHRDLTPGNVMLTKSGVKLLDFGLAKLEPSRSAHGESVSTLGPTKENPLTDEGAVLGTWPYMSPEQVEGKTADARSDIFSFGAMLYEMATGRRAFEGDSHASLIAAILERDPPPLADVQHAAPPALERVVRKCLAKDPDARWQSARDLADALKWIAEDRHSTDPRVVGEPTVPRTHSRRWLRVAGVVTALGLGATIAWNLPRAVAPAAPVRRFVIPPPADARLVQPQPRFGISPDGRALVYTAQTGGWGVGSLYLRPLDQLEARPIPGTEGGSEPAFSPDGQWVAFVSNGTLKKVSRTSGAPPVTIADSLNVINQSVAWLPDNTIVVGQLDKGLFRVSADGGAMVRLTTPDPAQAELDHHFPRALPGGKAILVTRHLKNKGEVFDVAVLQLDTGQMRVIVPDGFDARYVPTGHLVFARGQELLAAPFDIDRLELSGSSVVIVDHVMTSNLAGPGTFGWGALYAVADDGTLAYIPPRVRTGRRLVWAGGMSPPEPLPIEPRFFSRPSLSPDGTRVAVEIEQNDTRDIWIYDLTQGTLSRLTSDGFSEAPTWTRDSQRVTFSVWKDGRPEVHWQRTDGSPAERLVAEANRVYPGSWSPDGRTLAFLRQPPTDQIDIGLFDLETRRSTTLLAGESEEYHPRISPDGRWLAYAVSFERPQIHVAAIDGSVRRQITSDGGNAPVWSRDGQRLYYRGIAGVPAMGDFRAVDLSRFPATIGKATTVATGLRAAVGGGHHSGYDVGPDGRLLIVQQAAEESASLRFEIVLNWFDELKQRVPVRK